MHSKNYREIIDTGTCKHAKCNVQGLLISPPTATPLFLSLYEFPLKRIFVRFQKLSSVVLMDLLMSSGPPSCSRTSNIDLLILIILFFSKSGLNFCTLEFDVAQIIPAMLHMLATMHNNFFLTDFFFTRFYNS